MTLGSRLNDALGWAADRFVIGALTSVATLGVVTAPAALAAGAEATRGDSLREAVPAFVRVFRRQLRGGLAPGAVSVLLLASALVALLWAASSPEGAERVTAYTICLQAALGSLATSTLSAALLDMGALVTPRNIVVLASACPGSLALLAGLAALTLAASSIAPILALPVVGAMAGVIADARVKYERRILRSVAQPS